MTSPSSAQNELLQPVADDDGAPFWEYAAAGELRIQACAAEGCGELRFPPRPCCPHCQSFESEWRLMSGRGRIWSYVTAHPPLLPAYAALAPYDVVLVELVEAPQIRMVGNLVGNGNGNGNGSAPKPRIGAAVTADFREHPDGLPLPHWRLERP